MPKLKIDGVGTVEVGENFLQLSPEDQQRTVEEIRAAHSSRAAQPEDPKNTGYTAGLAHGSIGAAKSWAQLSHDMAEQIAPVAGAVARPVYDLFAGEGAWDKRTQQSLENTQGDADALAAKQAAVNYQSPQFKDVHGIRDFMSYAGHKAVESLPYTAAAMASGGTATVPMMMAEVNESLREIEGLDPKARLALAAQGGMIMGALETAGVGAILKGVPREFIGRLGARGAAEFLARHGVLNAAAQRALNTLGGAVGEGGTEAAQELTKMGIEKLAGKEFQDGEVGNRLSESFMGGFGAGGATRGAIDTVGAAKDTAVAIPRGINTIRAGMELDANPDQTLSDIRVGRMHEQELEDVRAAHTGNEPLDTTVLKNVKVELKRRLTDIVRGLHRNGDIDNEARASLLRNADSIMDASGNGLRELTQSDLDAVASLGLSPEDTQGLQRAFRDLNSITHNAKQKNQTGPFQRLARAAAPVLAHGAGQTVSPGFGGAAIGGLGSRMLQGGLTRAGGALDSFFGLQRPDVLRRYDARVRAAQNRGIDPGDTRAFLTDIEGRIGQRQQLADSEAAARVQREREFRAARRAADNPGLGGWDRETFDRTGLRPRQVDAGLDLLVQNGTITAEQAESFRNTPEDFQGTRTGMLIQDHLDELAAQGAITRDPNWSDPRGAVQPSARPQSPTSGEIRNPVAYAATVRTAEAARDSAIAAAPTPELRQAATTVADARTKSAKLDMLVRLRMAHPQHIDWINTHLAPLAEFGPKETANASNPSAPPAPAGGASVASPIIPGAPAPKLAPDFGGERSGVTLVPDEFNTPDFNIHTFTLEKDGENAGWMRGSFDKDSGNFHVENIEGKDGPNSFGPKEVRDLLRQLKAQYPGMKTITGFRATGARWNSGNGGTEVGTAPGYYSRPETVNARMNVGGPFMPQGAKFAPDFGGQSGGRLGGPQDTINVDEFLAEDEAFNSKERKRVEASKLAHKVRKSDGSYRGAPEGVTTPAALGHLRKSLYNLASEGKEGRFWYERSGRAILNAVGGNKVEAEKLAQLVAIYSQSTPVKSNFDYALQAYAQYQQTGQIRTGRFPTEQSKRAQAVMDGTPWEGRKTNNFYVNLMREIDPKSVQGVTADIWMMRAFGYKGKDGKPYSGSPTDAQYDFVERETEKVMERLNADLADGEPKWEPQQVQAAIWIAEKANHEGTSVHDAAYDYSTALDGALAQISWESIPGKTSGEFPEMFNAPYSQRAEYHVAISKAFLDAKGGDIVAKSLGVLTPGEFEAPGYFEGNTNPGSQTKVAAPRKYLSKAAAEIEPANVEQIDAYAIAKGILLKQDAMAWHRPFFSPKQKDANGAEVRIGRTLSAEENARLGENLAKVFGMGDIGPIGSEKGARLLNLGYLGIPNKDFQSKVQKAVDMTFGDDPSITPEIGLFAYQGNYITNDWSKSPNGEEYYAALAQGRSDLQRKVRDVVAKVGPRIEAIQEEFAQRYGWTRKGRSGGGVLEDANTEVEAQAEPVLTE